MQSNFFAAIASVALVLGCGTDHEVLIDDVSAATAGTCPYGARVLGWDSSTGLLESSAMVRGDLTIDHFNQYPCTETVQFYLRYASNPQNVFTLPTQRTVQFTDLRVDFQNFFVPVPIQHWNQDIQIGALIVGDTLPITAWSATFEVRGLADLSFFGPSDPSYNDVSYDGSLRDLLFHHTIQNTGNAATSVTPVDWWFVNAEDLSDLVAWLPIRYGGIDNDTGPQETGPVGINVASLSDQLSYRIFVVLDPDEELDELNEDNNVLDLGIFRFSHADMDGDGDIDGLDQVRFIQTLYADPPDVRADIDNTPGIVPSDELGAFAAAFGRIGTYTLREDPRTLAALAEQPAPEELFAFGHRITRDGEGILFPPRRNDDYGLLRACFFEPDSNPCDRADLNRDGNISVLDVILLRNARNRDLNGDGIVDLYWGVSEDWQILMACFFDEHDGDCGPADLDGDGSVNILDFWEFYSAFFFHDVNGDGLVDLRPPQ